MNYIVYKTLSKLFPCKLKWPSIYSNMYILIKSFENLKTLSNVTSQDLKFIGELL